MASSPMTTPELYTGACFPYNQTNSGIWLGDNPFKFSVPIFMAQLSVSAFFTGIVDFVLHKFGMCSFFSKMVGAILVGPTMFGQSGFLKELLFSSQGAYILETFHYLGLIFYSFMVGLKMDFRMVVEIGRAPLNIGLAAGLFPMIITYLTAIIHIFLTKRGDLKSHLMLSAVASTSAVTSFHSVAIFLADLKILNTEIGRLAVATSMVSFTCSFSLVLGLQHIADDLKLGLDKGLCMLVSFLCFILFIVYVLKPIMHWMIKQCPPGSETMKEVHVFIVFFMVLLCAGIGEFLGLRIVIGPLILGLAVPPGPPLAETVEDKLESMVQYVLMPLFYVTNCGKLSMRNINNLHTVLSVVLTIVLAFFTKVTMTILSSMYSRVPLNESLVLGLIIASQGVFEIITFGGALAYDLISPEVYTIMIYFSVALAGITSLIVKKIYRPSTDYSAYTKRSLGDILPNTRFQILTCIYQDINVPSIIDLLEASNPTDKNRVTVNLLHLIELKRTAPPFLITHKRKDDNSIYYNRSEQIIKAFRLFELQNSTKVLLNSFSTLSPCVTMHQDICSLAVDRRVVLIILPFHMQFNIDGSMETKISLRDVNLNVLKCAPCSVGILIDRQGMRTNNVSSRGKPSFHIAVIFLGGADDREALTYGMRMVEDPNTRMTVFRFSLTDDKRNILQEDKVLDVELLYEFRRNYEGRDGMHYIEETKPDVCEILKAIREINDMFDLIIVGRQHVKEAKLFKESSDLNEYPELGFIGDFLVASDLQKDASILVIQQKYQIPDDLEENFVIHCLM